MGVCCVCRTRSLTTAWPCPSGAAQLSICVCHYRPLICKRKSERLVSRGPAFLFRGCSWLLALSPMHWISYKETSYKAHSSGGRAQCQSQLGSVVWVSREEPSLQPQQLKYKRSAALAAIRFVQFLQIEEGPLFFLCPSSSRYILKSLVYT